MVLATEFKPRPSRAVLRGVLTLALTAFFAAGIVALMLVLAGYFEPKILPRAKPSSELAAFAGAEPAQGVVKLIRRPREESAVGSIRAVYEAVVASKILARVEEVRVKAGQDVKQGDVLVVLDKADLQSKFEQAQATEKSARAKYDQAVLEQGRAARLRARESITQSDLDLANTALTTAKAELDRSQRAVEETRILEDYATVRAPLSGRIVDKKVNVGDTVSQGQPLVSMYDPSRMQLVATVRETLALKLQVGQELTAQIDTFGYTCRATVSEIVPEAQAESRSFQVKVTGPCPPTIYSGMFGRIFIPLEEEEVLVVPTDAIRKIGQLDEVDVVENGRIRRRSVQLGRRLQEGREVLSGLSPDDHVLLNKPSTERKPGGQS